MRDGKISCVMTTKGRPALVANAVDAYLRQTYSNRELVIVSQGDRDSNNAIARRLESLGRSDFLFFPVDPRMSLGAMRNLSIELATGHYICQWDDDDWHHPRRLATQWAAIESGPFIASLFCEHLKYFQHTGELYWIDWSVEGIEHRKYLPGTAFFRKDYFFTKGSKLYPEKGPQCAVEEDWNVLEQFTSSGLIAAVHDAEQYVYVYHGANVYGLEHHQLAFRKRVASVETLLQRRESISEALRWADVEGPVVVRSLEDEAFVYLKESDGSGNSLRDGQVHQGKTPADSGGTEVRSSVP
jgi:glycosyltransferase involved in cell wall biosynthesis